MNKFRVKLAITAMAVSLFFSTSIVSQVTRYSPKELPPAPKAARVASKLRLRANPKVATRGRPLVLDGEGLTLESLALNGKPLSPKDYELTDGSLTIPRVPAQPFSLEIVTLCDPEANTALSGLYLSRGTYCTQCEPEGFRRITYFIDRPDVLAVYTVRIEADRATTPVLLSNGNPIAQDADNAT